mgnify:CR=1 FL=1
MVVEPCRFIAVPWPQSITPPDVMRSLSLPPVASNNASDACLYCINPLYSASPLVPSEKNIAPSFDVPERIVIPVCPDVAIVKSSAEE